RLSLRHHLQSPTFLSTPILNRVEYFGEPTRSYQTEVLRESSCTDTMDSLCYDADDEDEDEENEEEEEEEEEHLAPANSVVVIPTDELAAISFPPEAKVERLLAMPTPSPSAPASLSPPSARERLARCTAPATLPSPPLPPPLHMPPPIDGRDDIPETKMPPHKRLCLSTLGSRYEVGESSTARPTEGRGIDYGFVSTLDAEARRRGIREVGYGIRDTWIDPAETVPELAPMTVGEVNTRVTELVELHEHNTQDSYALLEDAKDSRTYISQRGEIKKLEIELWNLKVKENNVSAYTKRFQKLTLICTKCFADEAEKIDKYVSRLPNNIYRGVKASKPRTLDETIELDNYLMDQKLHTYADRQKNGANHKGHGCFECGATRHFKRDCPKLKNTNGEKVNTPGWVYAVGNAKKRGNASRDPDSNVVMGTFLLNNRYASILFDTGADRSFISTAFSSLIDIVPTLLENSYDVELADGKIVGIFLAQISAKKEEDKSEGKQLKDVPVIRDYPEVFPKDLPGLPPARPVKFQIDLIPGASTVARAPSLGSIRNKGVIETITRAF
nr:hypothetical protein [Tanacetum cinerariifolium]